MRHLLFAIMTLAAVSASAYTDVELGYIHGCALEEQGTIDCFGYENAGEVSDRPDGVFVEISANFGDHVCGLRADGTVHCWGDPNDAGSVAPYGLDAVKIATGWRHSCAIETTGETTCWGLNWGNAISSVPTNVVFEDISLGKTHGCAITFTGDMMCWGYNSHGQTTVPTLAAGRTWTAVDAGYLSTCGLDDLGNAHCWGFAGEGIIEDVPNAVNFLSIDSGMFTVCGVATNGEVHCWGRNDHGQATPPAGTFVDVSTGLHHSCATKGDGELVCWGRDAYGYLDEPVDCGYGGAVCQQEFSPQFSELIADSYAEADGSTPIVIELLADDRLGGAMEAGSLDSSQVTLTSTLTSGSGTPVIGAAQALGDGVFRFEIRSQYALAADVVISVDQGTGLFSMPPVEIEFGEPIEFSAGDCGYILEATDTLPPPSLVGGEILGILSSDLTNLLDEATTDQTSIDRMNDIVASDFLAHHGIIAKANYVGPGGMTIKAPLVFDGGTQVVGGDVLAMGLSSQWSVQEVEVNLAEGAIFFEAPIATLGRNPGNPGSPIPCENLCNIQCADDEPPVVAPGCANDADCCENLGSLVSTTNVSHQMYLSGSQSNHQVICGISCPATCLEPNGGSVEVPDELQDFLELCSPSDERAPKLDRMCQALGANAPAECPNMCRNQEFCAQIDLEYPLVGPGESGRCDLAVCVDSESDCCSAYFDNEVQYESFLILDPVDRLKQLGPVVADKYCAKKPDSDPCKFFELEANGAYAESDINYLDPNARGIANRCNEENKNCALCGGDFLNGCVMTDRSDIVNFFEDGNVTKPIKKYPPRISHLTEMTPEEKAAKDALDPVATSTGAFHFDDVDFAISSPGVPFEFTRSYSSSSQFTSGALGPGFTHVFEEYIEVVGDRVNRQGAPEYCLEHLPLITCLYRHRNNGRELYMYDPGSGLYTASAGGFNVIKKLKGQNGFVLRQPGGTTREYSDSGLLRSITDERGIGLTLNYKFRSAEAVTNEGNRYAPRPTLRDLAFEKFGTVNPREDDLFVASESQIYRRGQIFERRELDSITDSLGRVFNFNYETWANNLDGIEPAPTRDITDENVRRRRLKSIEYLGQDVVRYKYEWYPLTEEAYLAEVVELGITNVSSLEPAAPIRTRFERDFSEGVDHIAELLDFTFNQDATSGNPLVANGTYNQAQAIADRLRKVQLTQDHCGKTSIVSSGISATGLTDISGCNDDRVNDAEIAPDYPIEHVSKQLIKIAADNIVRKWVKIDLNEGSEVLEVETYYSLDPLSPDFDRVKRQRWGAMDATNLTTRDDDVTLDGDTVFTFQSKMPEGSLTYSLIGNPPSTEDTGQPEGYESCAEPLFASQPDLLNDFSDPPPGCDDNAANPFWKPGSLVLPDDVRDLAPLEETVELLHPEKDSRCAYLDAVDAMPFFGAVEPADHNKLQFLGAPEDMNLSTNVVIRRSKYPCGAIAARYANDPFINENIAIPADASFAADYLKPDQRRLALEWDLARVCAWTKITKRDGDEDYIAMNFRGQPLLTVERAPESSSKEYAVTTRRYNADGMVVFEQMPDGLATNISYHGQDTGVGSPFEGAPGSAVLFRASPKSKTQLARFNPGTTTRGSAIDHSPGAGDSFSARTWHYEIEPAFQREITVIRPDGREEHTYYDFQQANLSTLNDSVAMLCEGNVCWSPPTLPEKTSLITSPAFASLRTFSIPRALWDHEEYAIDPVFLAQDLDGDGTINETSGFIVAKVSGDKGQFGAIVPTDIGGGTLANVGQRMRRNNRGVLLAESTMSDLYDPSADTNVTTYQYYKTLDAAENGGSNLSSTAIGLLATKTVCGSAIGGGNISLGCVGESPLKTIIEYDTWGKAKSTLTDDGSASPEDSEVITLRDVHGRVSEKFDSVGAMQLFEYDPNGDLIRLKITTGTSGSGAEVENVSAYNEFRETLGSCRSLVPGACDGFQTWAEIVSLSARDDPAYVAPLVDDFDYSVNVFDDEERIIAVISSEEGRTDLQYDDTGMLVSTLVRAQTSQETTYTHDLVGRVIKEVQRDDQGNFLSVKNIAYDAFGRPNIINHRGSSANASFNNGVSEFTLYDRTSRVMASYINDVEANELLALRVFDYLYSGALFKEHQFAAPLSNTLPSLDANANPDDWATKEWHYDASGRQVYESFEGVDTPTLTSYSDFGVVEVHTPVSSLVVDRDFANRHVTHTLTNLVTGDASEVAKDQRTITTFDGLGREIKTETQTRGDFGPGVWGPTEESEWQYDELSRVIRSIENDGHYVDTEYDYGGRVSAVERFTPDESSQRRTEFIYDPKGRVLEKKVVGSQTTVWEYDDAGQVIFETVGNPMQISDPMITSYEHDGAGRITKISRSRFVGSSGAPLEPRDFEFVFDPGQVRASEMRVNGFGAKQWTYDGLDRVVEVFDFNPLDNGGGTQFLKVDLTYDAMGRVINELTQDAGGTMPGGNVDFAYGNDYRGMTSADYTGVGEVISNDYHAQTGLIETISRHNSASPNDGISFDMSYRGGLWIGARQSASSASGGSVDLYQEKERDGYGRTIGSGFVTAVGGSKNTPLSYQDVLYGEDGRIAASFNKNHLTPSASIPESHSKGYKYDGLKRLESHSFNSTQTRSDFLSKRFGLWDGVINVDAAVAPEPGAAISTFNDFDNLTETTSDEFNREYDAAFDTSVAGAPPETINGNALSLDSYFRLDDDGTFQYTHDALNRITKVEDASGVLLEVVYDGFDRRRIEKKVEDGALSTRYLQYLGANVVIENDANADVTFATTHSLGVDSPLAVSKGDTHKDDVYRLFTNVRGDVVAMSEYNGSSGDLPVAEAIHSPWGERVFLEENDGCIEEFALQGVGQCLGTNDYLERFGIGGARAEPSTRLVDLRARVYAPHLRGFLAPDPLGDVDSQGLWNYVAGDPINFKDPSGQKAIDERDEICDQFGADSDECLEKQNEAKEAFNRYKQVVLRGCTTVHNCAKAASLGGVSGGLDWYVETQLGLLTIAMPLLGLTNSLLKSWLVTDKNKNYDTPVVGRLVNGVENLSECDGGNVRTCARGSSDIVFGIVDLVLIGRGVLQARVGMAKALPVAKVVDDVQPTVVDDLAKPLEAAEEFGPFTHHFTKRGKAAKDRTAKLIKESDTLMGGPGRDNRGTAARAMKGDRLSEDGRGVVFMTKVKPDAGGHPVIIEWSLSNPGAVEVMFESTYYSAIPIRIIKIQ